MKWLYYLTKNIQSTESISEDLHQAGITDWNFHVMSKQNESGLYRRHIHSANTFHKSDIVHKAEQGVFFGFIVGLIAAWVLSAVPVFGVPTSAAALFFVVVLCVLFGGWIGGFVGIQSENYKITRFHDHLEEGFYLIMIDVVSFQESQVHELMKTKHPEAEFCVGDSTVITPFGHPKEIAH